MANVRIKVEGMADTLAAMEALRQCLSDESVYDVLYDEGGLPIKGRVEQNAPRDTGALSRAIVAKPGRKRAGWPSVIVAVDFKKIPGRDFDKASNRYPYIVEHGAKPHRIMPLKKNFLAIGGRLHFGGVDHPGFAGRYYFRRSVNQMRPRIKVGIERGLKQMIEHVVYMRGRA